MVSKYLVRKIDVGAMPDDELAANLASVIELLKMEVIKDEQDRKTVEERGEKAPQAQRQKRELQKRSKDSKAELDAAKILFGKRAIEGDDVSKLSGNLSLKQNSIDILESGLRELANQIAEQEAVVAKVTNSYYQAESTGLVDEVIKDSLELIKQFADLQVVIHKNLQRTYRMHSLRTEHKLKNVLNAIDFEQIAKDLQNAQFMLEKEIRVKQESKIPRAEPRGGYLDDKHFHRTLGSEVRDFAAKEATQ